MSNSLKILEDPTSNTFNTSDQSVTALYAIERPKPHLGTRKMLLRQVEISNQANYIRKIHTKTVSKCALDLHQWQIDVTTNTNRLGLALKNLKPLSRVHINLRATRNQWKMMLLSNLKYLTCLSLLSLHLETKYYTEPNSEMVSLPTTIKAIPALRTFKLQISQYRYIDDGSIVTGALSSLRYLPYLSTLDLDLSNYGEVNDKMLDELFKSLRYLTCLSSFNLDLSYCNSVTSKGIHFLSTGLKCLTSLSTLRLNLKFCGYLFDEGIESLAVSLSSLTQLTGLDLRVSSYLNKITDKSVSTLSNEVRKLESLSVLKLDFLKCGDISKKGIEDMKDVLRDMKHLSVAKLNNCLVV